MPVLVGREVEQARLAAVLDGLRAGQPALLALAGPAGIGKSALLADLTDMADYDGRVLRWRGAPAQAHLPFAALSGLLGALLRDDASSDDAGSDARQTLDRAFGRGEPHPIGRLQVGAAAMTVIARAAEREPVLVVVDDLHWVDTESIEALLFALQRLPADPVGLIIATRDVAQAESLGIETLTLDGLALPAVRELIGPDVAETVCAAIGAATAGNPLASKEIAATLTATERSGRSSLPDPFPETSVERVYLQRLAATPEASRRAGAVASAAGDAPVPIITRALTQLQLDLDALRPIEDAGLLRAEGDRLSWRHPLAASAAWRSASAGWQHDAHQALAIAWQAAGPDGSARAIWHRAATAAPGEETIAAALDEQAQRSAARDAYPSAAAGWQSAARLGDPELRAERLYRAARAYESAGQLSTERAVLRELLGTDPTSHLRAAALRALGRAEFEGGTPGLALALLSEAAELSEDPRDQLFCLSEAVFASMYARDRTASRRLAIEALAAADRQDPVQHFLALHADGAAHCLAGDLEGGARSMDAALTTAAESRLLDKHPELLLWVVNAPLFARSVGDLDDPAVLRVIDETRRAGDLTWLPRTLRLLGLRHELAGHWPVAYALFDESADLARMAGQTTQVAEALGALAWMEAARGDLEPAIAHAEESRRIAASHAVPWLVPDGWWAEAMARFACGDASGALAPIEQAVDLTTSLADGPLGVDDAELLSDFVEILVAAGEPNRVRPIVEALTRNAPASPATSRARAFVAEGEDAIALLELAATAPDPFVAARGHLLLGERLRRAGLRRRAREHLSVAARTFDGLGARPWAARCRTELAAAGQPDTRPAPTLGQLTAAELRIATLVGQGRPTRDVAATLFLSPKTVEFHLSSIYRKLGVANRTALAAWMAGQPT